MEGTRKASKRCILFIIRLYKYLISPLFPKSCRFYPTCSQYALEAIELHGAKRGLLLALKRVLKCHPLHPGGYDPVPDPKGYQTLTSKKQREKNEENGMESIFSNNTVHTCVGGLSGIFCKIPGKTP